MSITRRRIKKVVIPEDKKKPFPQHWITVQPEGTRILP